METINFKDISRVCEIRVVDRFVNTEYKFHREYMVREAWWKKKTLRTSVFTRTGYYHDDVIVSRESILAFKLNDGRSKYLIENDTVYYRPLVVVSFNSDHINEFTKYFNTFALARAWAEDFVRTNRLDQRLVLFH